MKVNIYIMSNIKAPKNCAGAGIYILECETSKGPVTKTKTMTFEKESVNGAELTMLIEALGRLNKPCELTIYTENGQVGIFVESGFVERWEANGWRTSKNVPVTNADKWIELKRLIAPHTYAFRVEKHSYISWMWSEIERIRKEMQIDAEETEDCSDTGDEGANE